MVKTADKYFLTDTWKIIERGFDPAYARVSESVFALSNETIGIRGCFDEGGEVDSLRGSYINGVYELQDLHKSYRGIIDKTHFMIPVADWLLTDISIDGEMLDLGKIEYSEFIRELDMRTGTLTRQFVWHTKTGKLLKLTFIRFVDMVNRERAYQRITFEPLNFTGTVEITTGITFYVLHEGRNACYWGDTRCELTMDSCAVSSRTLTSEQEVFAGAILDAPVDFKGSKGDKTVFLSATLKLEQETELHVDKKVVMIYDMTKANDLWENGQAALRELSFISFEDALFAQREYWTKHWDVSDVIIEPSDIGQAERSVPEEQQGIRFCSFKMAQTYNGGSVRHNVGAKGLTGESYNGHTFWDTEAYCLPFYLFTNPEAAKTLLMFRYNTLPNALERAKMLDCTGAWYPIATLNGDEACDLWQHASLQLQPSTSVAYGIWHYVMVTEDYDFLWDYGAEILLQIARFLTSRASMSSHCGGYGYYGVMGPDEFHMMVNNNTYTNYMGKRSLEYAVDTLSQMKEKKPERYKELVKKTDLLDKEIDKWLEIAEKMIILKTEDDLIEQHDGYFKLPHIDIREIPVTEFPLYNHWAYDRIYRNNMIKQPDVLMFLYLYSSSFSTEMKRRNYEYYEPRTIHESSLSPAIHSILAAELGKMEEAVNFFGYATRLDLDNYNRNTNEGLHTTSIAMGWVNIVYGFAGLRSDGKKMRFAPRLPEHWGRLEFSLSLRGRVIGIKMQKGITHFTLRQGKPIELYIYGQQYSLDDKGLNV
ncbi:MAG: family 65 glycosyl hydrolase [Oscillospiraceae bacterium]|jgi:maltose phosphorylase|nr:family 65 glycosyl hydrolase [Oscillospiraceae bacterium]